jgi:hypothetical protein
MPVNAYSYLRPILLRDFGFYSLLVAEQQLHTPAAAKQGGGRTDCCLILRFTICKPVIGYATINSAHQTSSSGPEFEADFHHFAKNAICPGTTP